MIYGTLCGPALEIPGGQLVVRVNHVKNHWFKQLKAQPFQKFSNKASCRF